MHRLDSEMIMQLPAKYMCRRNEIIKLLYAVKHESHVYELGCLSHVGALAIHIKAETANRLRFAHS